jgi:hypothetical protein
MSAMDDLQITDEEWKNLKESGFNTRKFTKALDNFDSIRNHAGNNEFSSAVYADIQKLKNLSVKVFDEGRRDCVKELFNIGSPMRVLVQDMENWLSAVRAALASLEELNPKNLAKQDEEDEEEA